MQFVAQKLDDQMMTISLEQSGASDVFVRVDGLVIASFSGQEVTVLRQSATQIGLNLIVEE